MKRRTWYLGLCGLVMPAGLASAADWPMWGRDNTRNMVSTEPAAPVDFEPGKPKPDEEVIDPATMKNVKWAAKIGSACYSNSVVAGGRVFIGTNNEPPKDPAKAGDAGILLCLDEATGKPLWQYFIPKLAAGSVVDYSNSGLCSSPTVEGDKVYLVTSRCEVVCLNAAGKPGANGAVGEADVVWAYDLRDELGSFPHQMASGSPLIVGDRLYVNTSNGVDWTNKHLPMPNAPALICLDKKTGKLLGAEQSGISSRTFVCNWAPSSYGKAGDKELVFFGGGDGICYAFEPVPVDGVLKEVWRCDCNPPSRKLKEDGTPRKPLTDTGPAQIVATPVIFNNRVYIGTGFDPDAGSGKGCYTCIDATKTGDITATGKVWINEQIGRTCSTCAVGNALLFVADISGIVYCLDPETGMALWTHDTAAAIWGSPVLAAGKLYVGSEQGALTILEANKEEKVVREASFDGPVYSSPVFANGIMYVSNDKFLFAISGSAK